MFLTGVLQSFAMVFTSAIFYIIIRLTSNAYEIKPIMFTVISLIMTSLVLSLAAGPGKYAIESIKSKDSWKYSITLIISYIADIYLIKYVSGTEAGIFNRMAIPVSILLAFLLLKRKPSKIDLFGMSIVCFSLFLLFQLQNADSINYIIIFVILIAISRSIMYMTSETHKQADIANKEGLFRDQLRVIAFVSFIAAIMFLFLSLSISILKTNYSNNIIDTFTFIPTIDNFVNMPSIIIGIITGLFIAPINRYLKWSATYKIKAENVLAILAFTPIFTLIFEFLLSFLPSFNSNFYIFEGSRGIQLALIVFLSTFGAGLPVFIKVYRNIKTIKETKGLSLNQQVHDAINFDTSALAIKLADDNKQDYEVILATVSHCQGDFNKTEKLLEIPKTTIETIYNGKGDYCLNEEHSLIINKNFREKVVLSDPLTGISNRTALMSALNKLYNNKASFALVFIDLNDFKLINDKLGHDAGDATLIEFSQRLESFLDGKCFPARFAGDEFCMILPFDKKLSKTLLNQLKSHCLGEFLFNNKTIDIKASFGMTHSKDYSSADALLKSADKVMYKEKKNK